MMMNTVKIHFELEVEEENWPPISVETLNGKLQSNGTILVDNTPFFVLDVAAGDIIDAIAISQNEYQFEGVVRESDNKAISIIFREPEQDELVFQYLKKIGCYCEYGKFGTIRMLAVCISDDQDYPEIKKYLDKKEIDNLISYAELCI